MRLGPGGLGAAGGFGARQSGEPQQFKATGTPLEIETVPQTGEAADSIKKSLARIKLPQGFKIGLYAIVPDARHMAVGTNAGVVFVGTRKTKV